MAAAAAYLGEPVEAPPADGISRVIFSQTSDLLLASSWDKSLHLYDAVTRRPRASYSHHAPLLDCCFESDNAVYVAGLDGQVKRFDVQTSSGTVLGTHAKAVQSVIFLHGPGLLVSGSWDQGMRLWDPRIAPSQNCVSSVALPGKVYAMSAGRERLVVGTSGRHVLIYDIRRLAGGQGPEALEQHRESSLKFQTRSLAVYTDGRGYALGSVEGRVAMEFFDAADAQANKYAFKCHRRNEGGKDTVYPVHSIAFHSGYGTFATGGGDGVICIWDGENKKRLFQTARYPTSVASMSFSRTGEMLAVAASYAYEQGERDHPPDAIYLRAVQDVEVRPKARKPPAAS
ncbi:hypothetical protein VOLCADRAFT_102432 [Volvox carteri f. nagariensis]|uniref:Uncharacterized protein n=1 Tax=Volvox carteri f. nagariensis TaxID=3068 RepID=D8UG00_VOLCA|nr:uncharacterized protein VOLCADRAFT_102432 [Volvox carteri f. nagariensis]EFJ41342.1 hypothetical protein VOLCADRAFT_102432 [Volvox carteri f. nagariensis]|eukprot:XP_002957572.1 hypothetical protein VOLCADRAFT_102432 [Volvox carteri f. nagariensis]